MRDKLFVFTADERELYRRQRDLGEYRLAGAEDALDEYSDHGVLHVAEVMEQCEELLATTAPWLCRMGCEGDSAFRRKTLLLAVKYHDVGMCGTDAMRELLFRTDAARGRCSAIVDGTALRPSLAPVFEAAGAASFDCRELRDLEYLAAHRLSVPEGERLLGALHDRVKAAIRRNHALESGIWMAAHREALAAQYGPDVDPARAALIAALHSGVFCGGERVAIGDSRDAASFLSFCRIFLEKYCPEAASLCARDDAIREIACLATILRLADTRRSGDRLRAIGGARLEPRDTEEGFRVVKIHGDRLRASTVPLAGEILLGEACTRFGPVRLCGEGGFTMIHPLRVRHADRQAALDAFLETRLPSYWEEIVTGLFAPEYGMRHTVAVRLEGIDPPREREIVAGWDLAAAAWEQTVGRGGARYLSVVPAAGDE